MSKKHRHLDIHGKLTIDGAVYEKLDVFDRMMKFKQNNPHHPENNLFFHVWQVARQLERENINLWLAGVFHDIGKLEAFQIRNDGDKEIKTFYGHEKASVKYIKTHLMDSPIFKHRGVKIEKIIWLIDQHLRIMMYPKMGPKKRKALNSHKWWKDLKKLRKADENGRKRIYGIQN